MDKKIIYNLKTTATGQILIQFYVVLCL